MINVAIVAIILTILAGLFLMLFLYSKRENNILMVHNLEDGIIANEYRGRIEIVGFCKDKGFKFNFYSKELFNQLKDNVCIYLELINSQNEALDREIISACLAIKVDIKLWEIESITFHDANGNCTVFIDAPLNPEIKWGMELDF
jgi:hypothetical protein